MSTPTSVPTATSEPTVPAESTPVPEASQTSGPCPTGWQLTVRQFVDADPACFGSVELTMRAWLDYSPPLGWEGPAIEPSWLAYPASGGPAALWQAPPTGEDNVCNPDVEEGCAWFFAHLDPASHLVLGQKRWIRVTGHVADPAAATCHYVPFDGMDEPLPDASQAVATCRGNFVVTSIVDAP